MNCPMCNSKMKREKVAYEFAGRNLGDFEADICEKCNETFFTEESSDKIDAKAKELNLWGIGKQTKISYSGNSLIIRIPKSVASFMCLKQGENAIIYPEGKKKIVVELRN